LSFYEFYKVAILSPLFFHGKSKVPPNEDPPKESIQALLRLPISLAFGRDSKASGRVGEHCSFRCVRMGGCK
jgi:hypothetical protein